MTKLRILVLCFVAVCVLEIWGIVLAVKWMGAWQTLALILLTGLFGTYMAKREGYKVMHDARERLRSGDMPGVALLDGVCVFAGGLLLILPGFFTDIAGLLLLLPPTRRIFRNQLIVQLRKALERRRLIL